MTPVALHHESTGSGPGTPLVLGGGLGTTLTMWEPQVGALARSRRVVRYDHRGHGGSPAPDGPYALADLAGDVLVLLDRLGIERACYAGLSLGGMVGMWLAIHAPARIERLALLCTSAHMPPASRWRERAAAVRAARSTEVVVDGVLAGWLTPAYVAGHPVVVGGLRAGMVAASPEGYAGCCEAIGGMDLRADVSRIAAPTLVIGGTADPSTPPEHQRRIAGAIAGARLELVSPAMHLASVEQAGLVTRLLAEHLDGREDR
jgi:3-oxoadipate enol-lactonase